MVGFLDLPYELRLDVYTAHYESITLKCIDHKPVDRPKFDPWSTAKSPKLALQQTCRQIHSEVGELWLTLVQFDFLSTRSMLDRLASLSIQRRRLIRKIKIPGQGTTFRVPLLKRISLPVCLELLPGLRLDVLTVDCRRVHGSWSGHLWAKMHPLICKTQGWARLRLLPSTQMLECVADSERYSSPPSFIVFTPGRGIANDALVHVGLIEDQYATPTDLQLFRYGALPERILESIRETLDQPGKWGSPRKKTKEVVIEAQRSHNDTYEAMLHRELAPSARACEKILGDFWTESLTWTELKKVEEAWKPKETQT
ncbi:MAG: hypothetical protein Q9162_005243 [Coniocarpon cinnabarinum]